jgi:hypothetical protein
MRYLDYILKSLFRIGVKTDQSVNPDMSRACAVQHNNFKGLELLNNFPINAKRLVKKLLRFHLIYNI